MQFNRWFKSNSGGILSNHVVRYLAVISTALGNLAVIAAALMFLAAPVKAVTDPFNITVTITGGGSTPFALPNGDVLHYMAPTSSPPAGWNSGSDSNNGLSQSSPWATPNHAMNCGDVIIAAPGSYNSLTIPSQGGAGWGAISSCPSSSGGIDGTGGIYHAVLLCGGTYVGSCSVVTSPSTNGGAIDINASHWAVEGWAASAGYTCSNAGFGFVLDMGNTTSTPRHHIAFINDIAYHNAGGFGINGQGNGTTGGDYIAVVGNIHQDSAGRCDGFSDASIDMIPVANADTVAGTHIFIANNIGLNNQQTLGAGDNSDGECMMFDTWDLYSYSQQAIVRNNICVLSERFGFQIFKQNDSSTVPTIKVYQNTIYASNKCAFATSGCGGGEFNYQSTTSALTFNIQTYNNIAQSPFQNPVCSGGGGGCGGPNVALLIGGNYNTTTGNTGSNPANSQNIFKGLAVTCNGSCDSGDNVVAFGGGSFGINTYISPAFNNTTDLLNNQMGTPSCVGFTNTVACEGYNANTQTLTNPSVIYDLQPTAGGTAGKGYQLPSTTCAASDSDFPVWLKGIVYLQWTGSAVVQVHDLVTTPCGM